jgi:EAL domain-containing protein (putative c-di-GMP-specific phosphodiesterase class I)
VRAVVDLAHALRLIAVAEGVETDAQHARLGEIGCDLAQGFRYGLPSPATDVEDPRAIDGWRTLSAPATPR